MQIKSCSRCLGDLYEEEILGERESVCLQCGYRGPALLLVPVRPRFPALAAHPAPRDVQARHRW
jgi:hypothetical protein